MLRKIIILFLVLMGLELFAASGPLFSCASFASEFDDDDLDGDDDDDDDDDDDPLIGEENEPGVPDDTDVEPYETIFARGYRYGYASGEKDGIHDCMLTGEIGEVRFYQVDRPDSLYNTINSYIYTVSYNKAVGYPEEYLPVSGNAARATFDTYTDQWKAGYREGYEDIIDGGGAEEEWYKLGYSFGYLDAVNDTYDPEKEHGEDDRIRRNGFYEPDHPDSLYNTLSGNYVSSYRDGYDAGWKDGTNEFSYGIGYSSKDFDPWRITTCPLLWDTYDRFVVQTGVDICNSYYSVSDKAFLNYDGDEIRGRVAAYSPFDYFFVDSDTYIKDGELIDRKENALINGVNTGVNAEGNWLYRAVDAGDGLYILIRYQVGDHSGYSNLKVRRYEYRRSDGDRGEVIRKTVTDSVNDYYNGNEPVVSYDSRKVVDAGRRETKDGEIFGRNSRSKRREIIADALLCRWEEGKETEVLGKINVTAIPKNNRDASVSCDYINYLGDAFINGNKMDRKDRFYRVSREIVLDGDDEEKDGLDKVTFAGTSSTPLLSPGENRNFYGQSPFFSLKVKGTDKEIKKFRRSVTEALKNETFNFEIARLNITRSSEREDVFGLCFKNFSYHSDMAEKVKEIEPAEVRRRDFDNYADYLEAVAEYDRKAQELKDFISGEEFKTAFLKELKDARNAYLDEYRQLMQKFKPETATFGDYLTENVLPLYSSYRYTRDFSEGYFKDGNKDGLVTPMEQWEYENIYGPSVLNDYSDNLRFNGVLDPGEIVIPDPDAWNADFEEVPDIKDVAWLSGTEYTASTAVILDHIPEGFTGEVPDVSDEDPELEPNEELFTQNEDVRLSFGSARLKDKKNSGSLNLPLSFVFYGGENADGEFTRISRKKVRSSGSRRDVSFSVRSLAGQSILLIDGTNNFEGSIAARQRENGTTGFGSYISDDRNFIAGVGER